MTMRQLLTMRHPIVFLLGALAAVVALVVLGPIRVVDAADVATPVEAETFDVKPTGTKVVTDATLYSSSKALQFSNNKAIAKEGVNFASSGDVVLMARATQKGGSPTLRVSVDGTFTAPAQAITNSGAPQPYTFDVNAPSGGVTIGVKAANTSSGRYPFVDIVSFPASGGATDTTAPETSITSGPSGSVTGTTATFEFTSNEPGSTFQCQLVSLESAPTTCTSPKSYSGLTAGTEYTFNVWATDASGNTDADPATSTFTPLDTTAPETSITSGPSGSVTGTTATFEFTSNEPGSTFQCQLVSLESAPTTCTSPKSYSGLTAGTEYTFNVWATDASGNTDADPATRTFTPLETGTNVNVRDFGATGDGTSNDTVAFESAMAEAARVGGVVYVPAPGNYRIASVTPPDNTHLEVQAGAVLKKYGTKGGPLFNIAGPNDTTFANNIHIEGVGGTFTMDLNDAGQETAGIRYRNVRNFSVRNMVCIQNNDNPSQEAPSSRRPCLAFLPTTTTPTNGVYNHPIDGEISNVHSKQSPYGWGLTQLSGGENLRFFDISSEGGVPLRLENYGDFTPVDNIVADGVRCTNGHDAVHMSPHGATHGTVTIQNVVADSCESALALKQDSDLGGSFASDSTISGVTVLPGNQAQLRDDAKTGFLGAWVIGPSRWCIDNDDPLGYTIGLSNVDCGGLSNRKP